MHGCEVTHAPRGLVRFCLSTGLLQLRRQQAGALPIVTGTDCRSNRRVRGFHGNCHVGGNGQCQYPARPGADNAHTSPVGQALGGWSFRVGMSLPDRRRMRIISSGSSRILTLTISTRVTVSVEAADSAGRPAVCSGNDGQGAGLLATKLQETGRKAKANKAARRMCQSISVKPPCAPQPAITSPPSNYSSPKTRPGRYWLAGWRYSYPPRWPLPLRASHSRYSR